ncbi:MAG: TonB-dependent receptor [Bacteroidetes bacterium]|nr:MAG: TonB-dependent receptor [Bacteroidota bacterium]
MFHISGNHNSNTFNLKRTSIILLFIIWASGSVLVAAQSDNLTIAVKDARKLPLPGATVHLVRLEDSVRVSGVTNPNGLVSFAQTKTGPHLVKISYVGFQPLERSLMLKKGEQQYAFELRENAISLDEVTVTARRPLIRQEGDRMIIDPEPLAAISTNTLEILESTPGLFVDQDGGIFLNSATPATIYINGREQKMSSQDINTILRSLPPGSVDRIEVIRTPSARFAASSSGGVINIVLKRGMKIGRFGSVNASINQGFYGNRTLGLSFNNGGSTVTSYVNLSYSDNNTLEELNASRFLRQDTTLMQSARTRRGSHQGYLGYGLNFEVGENADFSYDGRINGSLPQTLSSNSNTLFGPEDLALSLTQNKVENDADFFNIQQDLGFSYKLDTLGSDWDTRLSYTFNRNHTFQRYATTGLFPVNSYLSGEGDNRQQRYSVQMQSDLSWQLPWQVRLETGINFSWQEFQSEADYLLDFNDQSMPDPLRTNSFNYTENINAAYMQMSRELGWKVMLKTGFRFENTYMKGNQTIPVDTSFVVQRNDWFPYMYLSRPLFQIEGFELRAFMIYRRTISRPGYQNLNPYINFIDQFLYEVGNPELKPQFADNMELNISLDDMPVFALGRNYTRDIFSSVIYADEMDENIAVRTYDNLGKSRETYFRAIAGIPPGGRYFFAAGAQYNLNEYDGFYEGQPLSFSRGSWRFFTFHMLRIDSETRFTMSGFLMTRGQMNFYELNTFGMLNLGLNRTFLNKKLTVSLSARDVLRTMTTEFELNQGSIQTSGNRYVDNQRFGVSIRYNFGIPDRQERRNMFQFDNGDQP